MISDLPDNPLTPVPEGEPRAVPLVLVGGENGGLKSARVGELTLDLRQLLEKGLAWSMNGVAGLGGPFLFEAKKGEAIVLAVENKTAFAQPLHVHGHVWRLLERDGQPVDDQGWRDTAVVAAKAIGKAPAGGRQCRPMGDPELDRRAFGRGAYRRISGPGGLINRSGQGQCRAGYALIWPSASFRPHPIAA